MPTFALAVVAALLPLGETLHEPTHSTENSEYQQHTEAKTAAALAYLQHVYSENEIFLIEYCLAALHYYPNSLTGKPSSDLVAAIKRYQNDVGRTTQTGYLENYQLDTLVETVQAISIGGILLPNTPNTIHFVDGGHTLEISGKWLPYPQENRPSSFQWAETIVCHKNEMTCHGAFVMGSAENSGSSHYSTQLHIYKVRAFNGSQLIADLDQSYDGFYDQTKDKYAGCYTATLTVDIEKKIAKFLAKFNERAANGEKCPPTSDFPKTHVIDGSLYTEARRLFTLGRFSEAKTAIRLRPSGQKEQMLKVITALEERAARQLVEPRRTNKQ